MIASFVYQFEAIDPAICEISAQSFLYWRQRLGAKFEAVIAQYPPRFPVSAHDLGDGLVSTYEGALIMIRVLQDPTQLSWQFSQYRHYVELLFNPV